MGTAPECSDLFSVVLRVANGAGEGVQSADGWRPPRGFWALLGMVPNDSTDPVEFLRHMLAMLDAGVVKLPAFPQVVIRVQEVLRNPNYSVQMIASPISSDPTLAARLLNMANSAAFNATGRVIIDLGVALTRLGAQKVYSVVLAHAIQEIRRVDSLRPIAKSLDELWSDSVAVAHFCDAVVKRSKLPMPDAFVAGLLHRVGHLYILVQVARQEPSRPPVLLSRKLVDAWHPAIAKSVLKNWHVDDTVCEAVGRQADVLAASSGPPTLTDVLCVGIRLANKMLNSGDTSSLNAGGALARLNLSIEGCRALIGEAEVEIRALARALHP
jgi:HD-like signal output (HDOD) protein